jgi:tRNA threonylcarbamoyladenosine biosynthesis protein TsaB
MLDARRMEVYACIFNSNCQKQTNTEAKIIDENSYSEELRNNAILFFGNGAAKCRETLSNRNAHFLDDVHPLAKNMILVAEKAYLNKKFVDLAYFEPFYLKEFQTTTPKSAKQ